MSDEISGNRITTSHAIISILVAGVIVVTGFFILETMNYDMDVHYQITCMDLNNISMNPYLVENKSGVYCRLQDGSFEDITIREVLA